MNAEHHGGEAMSFPGTIQNGTVVFDTPPLLPEGTRVDVAISAVPSHRATNGPLSLDEFDRVLDDLAALTPPQQPLPKDFSRADIYSDHD
jgi:hypothetical protein